MGSNKWPSASSGMNGCLDAPGHKPRRPNSRCVAIFGFVCVRKLEFTHWIATWSDRCAQNFFTHPHIRRHSYLNQSINQSNLYSTNIPGVARLSGATASSVLKNAKSLKSFRNINRQYRTPVSTGGRPSWRGMFWDVFWRWQPRWLNAQIVEGCSKEKGHMSWRPLRQCWSWS